MKISEIISILETYLKEYGDINAALISNSGDQNIVNNVDAIGFYVNDESEVIAIFRDSFDYRNFQGAEMASNEDYENGYPGYEIDREDLI